MKAFIAWFAGSRPGFRSGGRRPGARRPKRSASTWLMIAGPLAAVAAALAAAALLLPSPPRLPAAGGGAAGRDAASGQGARAAAFERELWPLRVRFGDPDGSRLMAAWADERGRVFCGYYEHARPDPTRSADRFVIVGELIATEADTAPAPFNRLWSDRCSDADVQVH